MTKEEFYELHMVYSVIDNGERVLESYSELVAKIVAVPFADTTQIMEHVTLSIKAIKDEIDKSKKKFESLEIKKKLEYK